MFTLEYFGVAKDVPFVVDLEPDVQGQDIGSFRDCTKPLDPPVKPGPGQSSRKVSSFDPNDKLSSAGFGAPAFVQANGSLGYRIRFENKSDATAPAREIAVTDTLDANVDLETLELTEITFANRTISVPPGLSNYEAIVPITAGAASILVEVRAALDGDTRQVTLTLKAIDPATGWFPEDPLVGLLYPNDATGRGEGSISYLVRPKAGLPSGTVIENRARIVFDFNDPIDTPLVFNTLDALAPVSSASSPATATGTAFVVAWSGGDEPSGSGLATYDVYASDNGGPFVAILTSTIDTSLLFTGTRGHTYAFYTIATDHVGHVEAAPMTPDTFTEISTHYPWHNVAKPFDVRGGDDIEPDGHIDAGDALAIINYINAFVLAQVPANAAFGLPFGFLDTNGDDNVAPEHALAIINGGQGGEGEANSIPAEAASATASDLPFGEQISLNETLALLLALDVASQPKRRR